MRHDPHPNWRDTTPVDRIPIEPVRMSPLGILLANPRATVGGLALGVVFVTVLLAILIMGAA